MSECVWGEGFRENKVDCWPCIFTFIPKLYCMFTFMLFYIYFCCVFSLYIKNFPFSIQFCFGDREEHGLLRDYPQKFSLIKKEICFILDYGWAGRARQVQVCWEEFLSSIP